MESQTTQTQVLVVGGSLVGLSAAVFLASKNIPTILVEQHTGSSVHPRAIGFTPRTLELYRSVGLSLPEVPPSHRLRRIKVESLAGKWFDESSWTPEKQVQNGQGKDEGQGQGGKGKIEHSPHIGAAIAQDALEPILREKAIALGADVRLSTQLLRFEQDSDGVTAYLRNRISGSEYAVRAQYVIACDGHKSPMREALGITRTGRGHINTLASVLFRAPLDEYLQKGVQQFQIEQANFKAFLTTYNDGRWVLMTSDEERDEDAQRAIVAKALGRSDLKIELITTGRWEMSAWIADSYSKGRVFLAGDAAHTLPPTRGGYGANTGIEDVHNLAWKLAAVLNGESKEELLDTYDAERRPIGTLRHDQIFTRPDYSAFADKNQKSEILEDDAMEFGQLYRSSAVLGAGVELPPAKRPDQWAGQPGTRAPHMWMKKREGEKVSSLDLFQSSWVLLSEDARWCAAVEGAGAKLRIPVKKFQVGDDVAPADSETFRKAFGIGESGAVLVRPDGYIAWRCADSPSSNFEEVLCETLREVSFAKA